MKNLFITLAALVSINLSAQDCTNIEAVNYNPEATEDDGTCLYSQSYVNFEDVVFNMATLVIDSLNVDIEGYNNQINDLGIIIAQLTMDLQDCQDGLDLDDEIQLNASRVLYTINILGQPVDSRTTGIVIDIYEDGSTVKRINR